jgi:2-polyprenyl-3-methyl-5-hydroxy-6-metoxy-1,4-benzoquinol methylase
MKNFWDQRYKEEEFVYGEAPNEFFKTELGKLQKGKILLPAEGEGRNAVYAASKGWDVTAFDYSEAGREKTKLLANKRHVRINYLIESYESVNFPENSFDVIALIYTHTPDWKNVYIKLMSFLKPGGTMIIELFNKKQINNTSGGPKNESVLLSKEDLESIFYNFQDIKIWEDTCVLDEGKYHKGFANIVRCITKK